MVKKVVFLDINGVLDPFSYKWETNPKTNKLEQVVDYSKKGLRYNCLDNLKWLLDKSGAAIVMSSNMRHSSKLFDLTEMLYEKGLSRYFLGGTPTVYGARGNEIRQWLLDHPSVDGFVIIDDGDDMEELKLHLAQCDSSKGLTRDVAIAALKVLKKVVTPAQRAYMQQKETERAKKEAEKWSSWKHTKKNKGGKGTQVYNYYEGEEPWWMRYPYAPEEPVIPAAGPTLFLNEADRKDIDI